MASFTLPQAQPTGLLLKLPKELRLMIFEELFPSDRAVHIHAARGTLLKVKYRANEEHPVCQSGAILTTCQTFYAEAGSVLYSNFKFCVKIPTDGQLGVGRAVPRKDDELRIFTALEKVRKLSLLISVVPARHRQETQSREHAWLEQVVSQISGATGIRSLHVKFLAQRHADPRILLNEQHEFDSVLRMLHGLRCSGTITMTMGAGGQNFPLDSTEYWNMLSQIGG